MSRYIHFNDQMSEDKFLSSRAITSGTAYDLEIDLISSVVVLLSSAFQSLAILKSVI